MIRHTIIDPKAEVFRPTLMAVDPGLEYTGYAVFGASDVALKKIVLRAYGTVRATVEAPWDVRAVMISSKLFELWSKFVPVDLALEFPTFQQGERGYAAARSGATLKLAYLCGHIVSTWQTFNIEAEKLVKRPRNNFPVMFAPVAWKGTMPKDVTQAKCAAIYGVKKVKGKDHNAIDAIMIGHYYLADHQKVSPLPGSNEATELSM